MPKVLTFLPKHEFDCQKNYDDFIAFSKNELTLFSECEYKGKKGWACDKFIWITAKGSKLSIVHGICDNSVNYTLYRSPYVDFAKAYVRYELSLNYKDSNNWAYSLKYLYQALLEQAKINKKKAIDVMDINNSVINRTEELIRASGLSVGTKFGYGKSLEKMLFFLKKMRIKLDLPNWFNTFPSRVTTSTTVDKKSREIEMGKCPSDYQMLQVAEAFNRAETPRQKYFTSLCVMLMCQPSRSIELNGLTIHSLQRTEKGRWYLMWHPAKGGDSIQKWIPKLLEDVVQQAFERLINISAPARAAVKFAYDYPDTFMIHDECITPKNFAKDKSLTFNQFGKAMGLRIGPARRGEIRGWRWTKSNWIDVLISELNDVSNWRKLIPIRRQLAWPVHDN